MESFSPEAFFVKDVFVPLSPTKKIVLERYSSFEVQKKKPISPLKKACTIKPIEDVHETILPGIQESTELKQINYSKFTIKTKFASERKQSRFFSPPASPRNSVKDSIALVDKYKEIKNFSIESELKLHQLYGTLKDLEKNESNEAMQKTKICLDMINSVFLNNNETTKQFKEIAPVFESFLFCPKSLEEELFNFFKTKIVGEDKTYATIFQNILKEITNWQKTNLKKLLVKTHEIEKLTAKNTEMLNENHSLNEKLKEAAEKIETLSEIKIKYDLIDKGKNDLVLQFLNKENSALKQEIQNNLRTFSQEKEMLIHEFTEKINAGEIEKEAITAAKQKIEKELENGKAMFQKTMQNHQTLCFFLKKLKAKVQKNEEEISKLLSENQNLKIRAGVAWEELTPRPSLNNLRKALGFENLDFASKSTRKIIEELTELSQKKVVALKPPKMSLQPIRETLKMRGSQAISEDNDKRNGKWGKIKQLILVNKFNNNNNSH